MEIQHKQQENRGRFFISIDGERMALLDYSLTPGIMTINHTEVDERLKGKNVGYELVHHAAEYARTNNLKIIALCTFAHAVFEKRKEEYKDVLLDQS